MSWFVIEPQRIGWNMRVARARACLTAEELSAKSFLSVESIRRFEEGRHVPRLDSLVAIANALNISLDELIGRNLDGKEEP